MDMTQHRHEAYEKALDLAIKWITDGWLPTSQVTRLRRLAKIAGTSLTYVVADARELV
jgi:hypothetical protein